MADLVQRLEDDAKLAVGASRPRAFDNAIRRFTETLQTVPESLANEMSNGGFARMNGLAEQVISEIERRIEAQSGDEERTKRLAGTVDEIRQALEEAFRWRRHYLKT